MTTIRSNDPSPVEAMDSTERKVLVRTAVESLPPRQKTTLILAYFHGMTYPQVADAMECSVGTVKTQMSRALRALAGRLPSNSLESLGAGGQS
jgi:RNA polymerase sigma factor (sigma-70 family)